MIKQTWQIQNLKEVDVIRLAELISLKIKTSDIVKLQGDLGSGKTTFARGLIRAALAEPEEEIPSPTFGLVHTYHASRLNISHVDLYRLRNEYEVEELSLSELSKSSALILEWPERTEAFLGLDVLSISFHESSDPELRHIKFEAQGTWTKRLLRLKEIFNFLSNNKSTQTTRISYLQGDASARAYARLFGKEQYILMDWPPQADGPPIQNGLPYSRIAHLAENTIAFQSIATLLETHSFRVPKIYAADHKLGILLLEDLGNHVYAAEISKGGDLRPLWKSATDVLIRMRKINKDRIEEWNNDGGNLSPILDYDRGAYKVEIELLLEWYWPFVKGEKISDHEKKRFQCLWEPIIDRVLSQPSRCLTLRDYHSPNLLWMPDNSEKSQGNVGIIDFQDALIGHPAFDLVSLLQDARIDVPTEVEDELYKHYTTKVINLEPSFDADAFFYYYSVLGAQRNTKILGIFARLFIRDQKPQYLKHIPRIWRYLDKNLQHPELNTLKEWYLEHFPNSVRSRFLGSQDQITPTN